MVNSRYEFDETMVTRPPKLRIVPRAAVYEHLLDLLFFLYDGPNRPEAEQHTARQAIRDFAATAPELRDVVVLAQTPGQQNLATIAHRAPQIAPMMDNLFLRYGVLWNGQNKYAFNAGQWGVWQLVPEEINAIRRYAVSPRLRTEQLLTDLLKLARRFS